MTWTTPKTNWLTDDVIGTTDLNRIEGNIDFLGVLLKTVEEALVMSGDSYKAMAATIPHGAVIHAITMNNDTAISLSTGNGFGIGDSINPTAFGVGETLTKNSKTYLRGPIYTSGIPIRITPVADPVPWEAAGTITGTLRIKIFYFEIPLLPNAA